MGSRLLPYFAGIIVFVSVEAAIALPILYLPGLFISILFVSYSLWEACGRKLKANLRAMIGTKALLIASAFGFLLFTEREIPRHIIAISLSALLALIVEQVRFLKESGRGFLSGALSGLILLSYAATLLWASAFFYGLRIFFHIPLLPLSVLFFFITLFFHQTLLSNLAEPSEDTRYRNLWLSVFALELFLAAAGAPATIAVLGALLAIPLASLLNIYRLRFEGRLDKKTLIRNIAFTVAALTMVATTAQWR